MHSLKRLSLALNRACKSCTQRYLTSETVKDAEIPITKEKNIIVNHIDAVTTIGINREEKKNSLDHIAAEQLAEELDKFENDENAVVGVLHGIGGNFCAGYDLAELAKYDGGDESNLPHFGSLANRVNLSKKPLIAAMNGYTVGIGLELALMCDLRVMEKSAVLGFLNRRFGIPILCGGTVRLPALIGYSRAIEVILTGRAVSSEEAFKWGLVHRHVEFGTALGEAVKVALSFVKFPQNVLLADRASAHYATFSATQLEEAMQFEKDNSSHLLLEEGVKGAKRFVVEGIGRHGKFHHLTEKDNSIKELKNDLL